MVNFCGSTSNPEDIQALINNMEEVKMDEQDMLDDSLLSGVKADLHKSKYKDDIQRWKKRVGYYKPNKSAMCSVVLGQCGAAMQAKL